LAKLKKVLFFGTAIMPILVRRYVYLSIFGTSILLICNLFSKPNNQNTMKKYLFLMLCTFLAFQVSADPWEDLTEKEAKAVVKFLKTNPYILDYCDCCGSGDVYLMKVVSTEIVPCSYAEGKKSVIAKVVPLGKLETDADGTPSAYRVEKMSDAVEELIVTMNYTFVLDKKNKWAVPFFKVVPYSQNHVCKGATRFPNPADNPNIKDTGYKAWFKKMKLK
jgi:hypothetical protein